MTQRLRLARTAARRALTFRVTNGLPLDSPCDIYELICRSGLDLQFVDIPSLEGMYLDEPECQRICVCAHRPAGRQRFTAAHELAHHIFQHGTQLDAVVQRGNSGQGVSDEELLADAFARYLLMPARAVHAAFRLRNIDPSDPRPVDVYVAACWLGVGYETLLNHMQLSLNILPLAGRQRLSKTGPKAIRSGLYGGRLSSDLWPLDGMWAGRRLHSQIGDVVLGLKSTSAGPNSPNSLLSRSECRAFTAVGVGEVNALLEAGPIVRISISRLAYVGFYDYRYMLE
jgi:IrrE N-terminal-like domain